MTTTTNLTNTEKVAIGVGVAVSVGWGLAAYQIWNRDQPTFFSAVTSQMYDIGASWCRSIPNYMTEARQMPMAEMIKPRTIARGVGAGLMSSVGGYTCLLAQLIDKRVIGHEIPQELRDNIEKAKQEQQAVQAKLKVEHEEIQSKLDALQAEQGTQTDQITGAMEESQQQGNLVEQLQAIQVASDNATQKLEQKCLELFAYLEPLLEQPEDLTELQEVGNHIQSQKEKKEELAARLKAVSNKTDQLDELEKNLTKQYKEDFKCVKELQANLKKK